MLTADRASLDRSWIEQRIPHRGRMCLLDSVQEWDAENILASSCTHQAADHPLRAHGRLGAVCGVEYAAQAMAVHGALLAGPDLRGARQGLLVSIRGLQLDVERLDGIATALRIRCRRLQGDAGGAVYRFSVEASSQVLLSGRAAVVFKGTVPP